MSLLSFTTPACLALELGKLAKTLPDFAKYDDHTTPNQYYLWLHDDKIETFKGCTTLSHWKKISLAEIVKLGSSLFNSIEAANLPTYVFFFTLMQDHFAGRDSAEALLNTILHRLC